MRQAASSAACIYQYTLWRAEQLVYKSHHRFLELRQLRFFHEAVAAGLAQNQAPGAAQPIEEQAARPNAGPMILGGVEEKHWAMIKRLGFQG